MDSVHTDDIFFMRAAINEAKKAMDIGEVPIGAVVVADGMIIGRGHNMVETLGDVTAHAEMQAITAATQTIGGKYLTNCSLYVTVEPCIMCAGACGWSQVSRVVYGVADPKRGYSTLQGQVLHKKTEVKMGILEEQCGKLLEIFFKKLRE